MSSSFAPLTGGELSCVLDVANIRQLFQALGERYPDLASQVEADLAVAVDGEIYQDALLQAIPENAEVFVFPRIAGG